MTQVEIKFSEEDNLFLTHQTVNNLLIQNQNYVKSQKKSFLDLNALEKKVNRHPMIYKSDVSVDVYGGLEVNVVQKKPIARVFGKRHSYYLDSHGGTMPLSTKFTARVMMVDNENGLLNRKEIFPLIQSIHQDLYLKKNIVMVKKSKMGYWLETRVNHQKVFLGSLEGLKQKLTHLKAFYNYTQTDVLAQTFKKIDLQYSNQIVCTK